MKSNDLASRRRMFIFFIYLFVSLYGKGVNLKNGYLAHKNGEIKLMNKMI